MAAPIRPTPNTKALMGSGTRIAVAAADPIEATITPITATLRENVVVKDLMVNPPAECNAACSSKSCAEIQTRLETMV